MEEMCVRCKGRGFCKQPCKILAKFIDRAPRVKTHFSGSTPPEVFVGKANYPNVFSGILSPTEKGDTTRFSSCEEWVKKNLSIEEILELRGAMIYGRSTSHIRGSNSLKQVTQELALSSRPVSSEFFLKKKPSFRFEASNVFTIMANPALLDRVRIEENPIVEKKVDYLTGDHDVKATTALMELYKSGISNSHLNKLLSVGLLGVKMQRKMVPTRWSITAVDDTISKQMLDRIRFYQELNDIRIFNSEYNGNHYEILLLPGYFEYEVIEARMGEDNYFMQDYENFHGRKDYAREVAGAYYANRLAVCEYLERVNRQASALIFREVRPEYYAPLGVGILREATRNAFNKKPETATTIGQAFGIMQTRMRIPINRFMEKSWLLKHYGQQKKLRDWF